MLKYNFKRFDKLRIRVNWEKDRCCSDSHKGLAFILRFSLRCIIQDIFYQHFSVIVVTWEMKQPGFTKKNLVNTKGITIRLYSSCDVY